MTTVTAASKATPRMARRAATAGAIDHPAISPLDLSSQTCHMGLSVHYGVYMVLAHCLLSRVVETHCHQPALVDLGPALAF